MASVKAALLDQLPYNLRPKIKFFSRFRLRFVGLPVILLFLIFLCSNFPSKKTYLLRPTINAFEADSSYTVVSTLSTSVFKSLNATNESSENATMAVSDGIGEHTHLTNLSLSLEMKNGVQETLVHGQTLVANTTRSPETIPSLASKRSEAVAVRNSSFDGGEGRISFGNLRPEEGKIGNSSDGSEIRPSNSSFHVGNSRPEEGKVGNSSDRVENQVSNSSFHGGDGMVIVGNLRHAKGKMGNLSDRGEIPLSYYGTQLAKKGSPSIDLSRSCNIFDGNWVRNESNDTKPYYPPGSCPYVDRDFDCFINGRPDDGFVKWRWQPTGCNLPRLNATDFLERLRGKKLVFVGDSLNRNMWESLVCILRQSIRNKKKVYEISGRTEFKKKGFYAFRFEDYNCSVDFVGSPFLVRESAYRRGNGTLETLRLDLIDRTAPMYQDADILVFNTGHWWTHEKTSRGEDYYQEGNHVHPRLKVLQAYTKALTTWSRWVDDNINPNKTLVFFRGYSITHFRGGQWNSGGQCHKETEPIFNETYLGKYPSKMRALDFVLQGMKTPVIYLNISRMTDYRKDGHPSIYRKAYATAQERVAAEQSQDCSHWCLPGVPDTWNELLYASLRETNKEGLR